MGSPYIGLNDRYNPQFNLSAETLQKYLEDVVVSTMSLKLSKHNGDIESKQGGQTYSFSGRLQFYAGYASCLVAAAGVYVLAFLAMGGNRRPVGSGFPNLGTAASQGRRLRGLGREPGGYSRI